jgi:hypothetical protein
VEIFWLDATESMVSGAIETFQASRPLQEIAGDLVRFFCKNCGIETLVN